MTAIVLLCIRPEKSIISCDSIVDVGSVYACCFIKKKKRNIIVACSGSYVSFIWLRILSLLPMLLLLNTTWINLNYVCTRNTPMRVPRTRAVCILCAYQWRNFFFHIFHFAALMRCAWSRHFSEFFNVEMYVIREKPKMRRKKLLFVQLITCALIQF